MTGEEPPLQPLTLRKKRLQDIRNAFKQPGFSDHLQNMIESNTRYSAGAAALKVMVEEGVFMEFADSVVHPSSGIFAQQESIRPLPEKLAGTISSIALDSPAAR
ncbi:MAG: hypothetical protein SFX19_04590 [Alphaproteobacteria bacterium]|nr:hypothetical protein [Alphaproteobacteria bacterium]